MIKHTTDYNVLISVREPIKYSSCTDFRSLLDESISLVNFWNLYDCNITISTVQLKHEHGNVTHVSKSKYWVYVHATDPDNTKKQTLCHEIAHIHQIESGILSLRGDGRVRWKNEIYTRHDVYTLPYHTLPWEIDAQCKEKIYWKFKKF